MSVPTNLIPTKVTGLPEYTGSGTYGYMPYVIDGRTYKVQFSNIAAVGAVPSSRTIATGTGLTGGGDLSQDRTIAIAPEGVSFDQLAPSGVVAGVYGSGTAIPVVTVDAKGRVTSATTTPLSISGYVPTSRSVFAGTGLTGGGDLASDVTLAVNFSDNNPQALGTATAGVSTAAARGDHVHPAVDLSDTSQTQGALPLGRGGTGDALSPVAGAVVYSTGTKFALTNPGIAGQVLMSNGVDEPLWATVSGIGTVTSVNASGGTTGLTFTGGPVTTAGTLTLGGTLAVTHGGTGATDAATARSNLGAAASGANSDITSMSGITGAIGTPDYIDFDTAATVSRATGRLWWDNADGNQTLSLGMAGSNATLQIGEEMYFRIKASSAITEGQAVMFTGTLGASGGLTGAPATGLTKDTASYLMGVATEDIPLNEWGYVTQFGLVRGFNTTGGAEAWVDGQILYYNPAVPGGLTKTVPAAPAAKVEVAAVVHAASNGSIFVRPTARFSLTQLNDVETSAAVDLDLLQYNGTSGVWQHKSPALISVGSATNLAGGAANRIAYQTGAGATGFVVAPTVANTYLEWSGSAFQWSANPLGTVTSVDASGGTTGLTFTGGPVTTAGTLTLGGTLGVANGGTGATSLTSGYLLKGNGTSAVSSSVIYDDGTNVGIGTASPGVKLDVNGVVRSNAWMFITPNTGTDNALYRASNTGGTAYMGLDNSAGGLSGAAYALSLYHSGAYPIVLSTNATERLRITSAGNVGIGTTSITAGYKLDIAGSANASGSFVSGGGTTNQTLVGNKTLLFYNTSVSEGVIQSADDTSTFTSVGISKDVVRFATQNSERMRIDGSGNLLVGTTSATAGYLMSVNGALTLANGYSLSWGAYNSGGPTIAGSTNFLAFYPNGASSGEKMRITSAGDVGIGTTGPLGKFSVVGQGTTQVGFNAGTTGSPERGNIWYDTDNSGWKLNIGKLVGSTFTAQMTFQDNGNVGIGTSSPQAALHVAGGVLIQNANAINELTFSGPEYTNIYSGTTSGMDIGITSTSSAYLRFLTNNTEQVRINSAGDVGIGTSSIGAKLETYQTAGGTNAIRMNTNFASGNYVDLNPSIAGVSNGGFSISLNGTIRQVIDVSGNVGIGTTGPSQRLDAAISSGTEGVGLGVTNLLAGGYGSGINFYSYRTDGTTKLVSGAIRMFGQANWADATNTSSSMRFYTVGNNTLAEHMRITASGDVGIGTTSPGAKFAVSNGGAGGVEILTNGVIQSYNRATSAYQTMYLDAQSILFRPSGSEAARIDASGNLLVGGTTVFGKVSVQGNTNADLDVWIRNDNAGSSSRAGIVLNASGNSWRMGMGSSANNSNALTWNVDIGGANTERMRIDTSGNVGIGTSSPGVKLEVNGAIAFGASMTSGVGITTQDCSLELGGSRGGDGNVYFDMHATSGTDFETRFIRFPGTNGAFNIVNTGTGDFLLNASGAANLKFATSNTERIQIDANGLVGINVAPSARLHVTATTSLTAILDSSANTYLQFRQSGTNTFYIQSASTYMAFWNSQNTPMIFANNGSEKMRLDASGSLGIGTTPSAALGGGTVTLDVLSSTNGEAMFRSSGDVSTGAAMQVFIGGSNNIRSAYIGYGGINNVFDVWNSLAGAMTFGTSNSERMRIASGGNVGIGTSSPNAAARLDVSSTTSGFLPPRMTTTQRDAISSPPDGLILYNSTTSKLQVRAGGAWVDLH